MHKDGILDYGLGIGAGYAMYKTAENAANKIRRRYGKFVYEQITGYTPEEKLILKKAVQKAFDNSGLTKKGVVFRNVSFENAQITETQVIQRMLSYLDKFPKPLKKLGKRYLEKTNYSNILKKIELAAKGQNSFYHSLSNDILLNTDKLPSVAIHEIGHAMNNHGNKFLKILSSGHTPVSIILPPLILATGLLKSKKEKGEPPKNNTDKTLTFIKENAGKLTFAALLPRIIEEGTASINASKLAKQVLDPKLCKKVNKTNFVMWSAYLLGSILFSSQTALAVLVRDKIADKK